MKMFKTPKMPGIRKAPEQPDEAALAKARRREVSRTTASSGRRSTALSTGGRETLGA